jgi:RNA polymerase sigma-70 factor (ECF subfamily)
VHEAAFVTGKIYPFGRSGSRETDKWREGFFVVQLGRRHPSGQAAAPDSPVVGTIGPAAGTSEGGIDEALPLDEIQIHEGNALREQLVARARNRDIDAWEALYRLSYPGLRAYASRRVGPDNADDVVSETMARAVASLERYEAGRSFNAWLFGIVRNVIGDMARKRKRWERHPPHLPQEDEQRPGEALELDAEHAQILDAFGRLSDRDREVLELRVGAGLTADQVGAGLGMPPDAVRPAQSRALARLRKLMAEADG